MPRPTPNESIAYGGCIYICSLPAWALNATAAATAAAASWAVHSAN